jgi:hypothetical protein
MMLSSSTNINGNKNKQKDREIQTRNGERESEKKVREWEERANTGTYMNIRLSGQTRLQKAPHLETSNHWNNPSKDSKCWNSRHGSFFVFVILSFILIPSSKSSSFLSKEWWNSPFELNRTLERYTQLQTDCL